MGDERAKRLSEFAKGFSNALDKKNNPPEKDSCPHCGQDMPSPAPSGEESLGEQINYPIGASK